MEYLKENTQKIYRNQFFYIFRFKKHLKLIQYVFINVIIYLLYIIIHIIKL